MMKTIPHKSGWDFRLYKNKRGQRSPPKIKQKRRKIKKKERKKKRKEKKEKINERKREKGQLLLSLFHTCASKIAP